MILVLRGAALVRTCIAASTVRMLDNILEQMTIERGRMKISFVEDHLGIHVTRDISKPDARKKIGNVPNICRRMEV